MFTIYKHCSSGVYYLNYFATYAGFVFISTWVYQFLKFELIKNTLNVGDVKDIPIHGDFWGYTVLSDEQLLFRVVALSAMLVLSVVGYRTVTSRNTALERPLDERDLETIKQMDDDILYNALLNQKESMFWSHTSVFWPVINFCATFFHIPLLLIVVYQSLFWRLNWVMLIYLFFVMGPWYGLDLKFLQTKNDGKDKPLTFYSNIVVRSQRYKKWVTLMWITIIAWVIIFPSQKVIEILDISVRTKAIYYGEWVGVLYPDTTPKVSFWNYVSGYMCILSVLVLEKKFLDWLNDEDLREKSKQYQETIGERDHKKNYELLSKEVERRKIMEDRRAGRNRATSGKGVVGFAELDDDDKINPKIKLKQEIDDAMSILSKNKNKEETKKPHTPYLKSALKKSIMKSPTSGGREEGPTGPKPFDQTITSHIDDNGNATDEEFNLIFTRDDPKRNETKTLLLFQYKIKFMRGAKTFAEECMTFALLL